MRSSVSNRLQKVAQTIKMNADIPRCRDLRSSGTPPKRLSRHLCGKDLRGIELRNCSMTNAVLINTNMLQVDLGFHILMRPSRSRVLNTQCSSDGSLLAFGTQDCIVYLVCLRTGKTVHRLVGHSDSVLRVAFTPDSAYLASGSTDTSIICWDVTSGTQAWAMTSGRFAPSYLCFSPTGTFFASADTSQVLRIWKSGQLHSTSSHFSSCISYIQFTPDEMYVICGCNEGVAYFVDVATGATMKTVKRIHNTGRLIAVSPSAELLAFNRELSGIAVIDTASKTLLHSLEAHRGPVSAMAFSPCGTLLVSGGIDMTIIVWDVGAGLALHTSQAHTAKILSVSFSPDASLIASSTSDGTVAVTRYVFQTHEVSRTSQLSTACLSPNNMLLATGCERGSLTVWILNHNEVAWEQHAHSKQVSAIAFSSSSELLASGSLDWLVFVWSANTGEPVRRIEHKTAVSTLTFTQNDRSVAVLTAANVYSITDVFTGEQSGQTGYYCAAGKSPLVPPRRYLEPPIELCLAHTGCYDRHRMAATAGVCCLSQSIQASSWKDYISVKSVATHEELYTVSTRDGIVKVVAVAEDTMAFAYRTHKAALLEQKDIMSCFGIENQFNGSLSFAAQKYLALCCYSSFSVSVLIIKRPKQNARY